MLSAWNPVCQIMACSKFLWASYKPLKNGACSRNTGRAITAAALTRCFALAWWSPASSSPPLPQHHFGFPEGPEIAAPPTCTSGILHYPLCLASALVSVLTLREHLFPLRSVVYPRLLASGFPPWQQKCPSLSPLSDCPQGVCGLPFAVKQSGDSEEAENSGKKKILTENYQVTDECSWCD